MNITYTQNGDYLIPNIVIRKTKPLGHYGRLRKAYLDVRRHIAVGANRTVFSPDSPTRLCRAGTYRAFLPAWRHVVVALFERQHCFF